MPSDSVTADTSRRALHVYISHDECSTMRSMDVMHKRKRWPALDDSPYDTKRRECTGGILWHTIGIILTKMNKKSATNEKKQPKKKKDTHNEREASKVRTGVEEREKIERKGQNAKRKVCEERRKRPVNKERRNIEHEECEKSEEQDVPDSWEEREEAEGHNEGDQSEARALPKVYKKKQNVHDREIKKVLAQEAKKMLTQSQWRVDLLSKLALGLVNKENPLPNPYKWIQEVLPNTPIHAMKRRRQTLNELASQDLFQTLDLIFNCRNRKFFIESVLELTANGTRRRFLRIFSSFTEARTYGTKQDKTGSAEVPLHAVFVHWYHVMGRDIIPCTMTPPHIDKFFDNPIFSPGVAMQPVTAEEVKATDLKVCFLPDASIAMHWEMIPPSFRALFYNMILALKGFPSEMLMCDLFWEGPEKIIPMNRGNFDSVQTLLENPICTVPHAVVRQLHSIIARRMEQEMVLDHRRFGLLVIAVVTKQPVLLVSIKFAQPYPHLFQDAVVEAFRRNGAMDLAKYLENYFAKLELTKRGQDETQVLRGVPSEDPLAPLILTLTVEQALRQIPHDCGLNLGGYPLRALVAGNEAVLLSHSEANLQRAVVVMEEALAGVGLRAARSHCRTAGAGIMAPNIALRAGPVPVIVAQERWRCFGHYFVGGIPCCGFEIVRMLLELIRRVPLSRNSRFELVKIFIEQRLQGEYFYVLPSPGDDVTYDQLIQIAIRTMLPRVWTIIEENATNRQEVYQAFQSPQCKDRHLVALAKSLRDWRRCWRRASRGSPVDFLSRAIDKSNWFREALNLLGVKESLESSNSTDITQIQVRINTTNKNW